MSSTLISITGFVIGIRIILNMRQDGIVNVSEFWRILILMISLFTISAFSSLKTSLILVLITLIVILSLPIWSLLYKKRRFNRNKILLLDYLVISLRSGKSFRQALSDYRSREKYFEVLIRDILKSLINKKSELNFDDQTKELFESLKNIDQAQFRTIERLNSYRYRVKTEENFRQKSSQMKLQSRLQSQVLSLIYVSALFFVIMQFGWQDNRISIQISILWFLMGHLWIFRIGKGLKWKI